ncbi:MAG TPA: hypothetical protein VK647_02210 [Gemmatimonadales bacterium]|nr:hypothetical protein [Gemmatimonadales bacterium]
MNVDRRDSLKVVGAAALATGAASLISACRGLVRADLAREHGAASSGMALDSQLADIFYHASLAPSGHNAQPWTVRLIDPARFVVSAERSRWLPAVDPQNREMLLSLGAFLENLIVAARHHGYDVEYRVVARIRTDRDVLGIRLTRTAPVPFPLEKIQQRRTVRRNHLPNELRGDDLKALARPFGDRFALFPRGSAHAKYLEEGTIEANRVQAYRDDAQEELSRWIRFRDQDGRRYRNGLTPESMEITGLSGWFVRHFMSPESVMKPSFRDKGVDAVREQVRSYGAWLVLSSADSTIPTLIETGRAFERMLLGIREQMIAIHPMTQMLEEAPMRNQVARDLGLSGDVQFILRAGYLKRYPDPVSLRMPAAWFVTA